MGRLRNRAWTASLAGLLAVSSARAQDPRIAAMTELFAKAKAQFRGGGYSESLATLEKLDAAARAPGLEAAREKIAPSVAFYRGADLAALGRKSEAVAEFKTYLAAAPAVRLDPSMYPKPVLEAFAKARDEVHRDSAPAAGAESGLAEAYAHFRASPAATPAAADEKWGDGAIRFFMTADEKADWQRLNGAAARAEFAVLFWQRRDPTPETPVNEYRDEIERRIQFADATFAQAEKRGSETDRGMVFVVMGPPSAVVTGSLKSEDDPIQTARAAPGQELVKEVNGRVTLQSVSLEAKSSERIQGRRETWRYRRDRLPASVAFSEVSFDFLTKDGYGVGVLQREPNALAALELVGRPSGTPLRQ
ncbi:MAG TPA: GWxTD domain-containing protein [Thermoanaerobaculia bacterium]|nr:GWxTD domain-containing protein [Thermoanaerobaculia bacterium]